MDRRYKLLNDAQVRNREEYYACKNDNPDFEYMPQIVIIIDELADLMLQAKEHVEGRINRLAAMARACGMHIVIGTQRPSTDILTGVIKANIPSQVAFKVASQIDSRVILNSIGAEKLLGRGDMLYHETGKDIVRLQGAYVDTHEIKKVLKYIMDNNGKAVYNPEIMYALQQETDKLNKVDKKAVQSDDYAVDGSDPDFELLCQAAELVIQMGGGISKNVIQRHLKIGFNRSANIFDKLEELGFISPPQGNKPRDCTVTWEQYQQWKSNNGK
jgi:S-DNA-T family DNA segregation ATPase FtsK/SpoIIIE